MLTQHEFSQRSTFPFALHPLLQLHLSFLSLPQPINLLPLADRYLNHSVPVISFILLSFIELVLSQMYHVMGLACNFSRSNLRLSLLYMLPGFVPVDYHSASLVLISGTC